MRRWIVDIEANGFYDVVTAVHCLVIRDADNPGNVRVYSDRILEGAPRHGAIEEGVRSIDGEEWIGHNLVGYDVPVLEKLGYRPSPAVVTDTLVRSRLFYTEIKVTDLIRCQKDPTFPRKMIGGHSLESWGHRLGCLKGAYGKTAQWETFTHEMLEYCVQDTAVTFQAWELFSRMPWDPASIAIETDFARNISGIMQRGLPFDVRMAEKLTEELQVARHTLRSQIEVHPTFAPFVHRWVTPAKKQPREKTVPFNPDSPDHIARALIERCGWAPDAFTPTGKPQCDAKALKSLKFPGVALLRDYIDTSTTLAALAEGKGGWLKLVTSGRIHQFINHNGTNTGRCTHSRPAANAPKVRVRSVKAADGTVTSERVMGLPGKFGVEFRSCVRTPDPSKLILVGADASSGEARMLAHYMARYDNGAYSDVVVNGDIHEVNRVAAGLSTRDQAKTFFYALLYGAGDAKIGAIVGGTKEDGRRLKERFFAGLPALAAVIKAMRDALLRRGQAEAYLWKGQHRIKLKPGAYLLGLDGRRLYVRSEHSMLNTLLQGALAVVMKVATNLVHVRAPGVRMVLHYHDEFQSECPPAEAHALGALKVQAIRDAGTTLKLRCSLDGEYKVGPSWAETH